MTDNATWKEMDESYLGDNANAADLAAFQRACKLRNHVEDETEAETTERMWGQGDFLKRVLELVDYDPDAAEALSDEECADLADAIRMGDYDR